MFITLVLSNQVKPTDVKIETDEGLHIQDETCQIKGMLYLIAIGTFYFECLYKQFNVLLHAEVHNNQMFKSYELLIIV